MKQLPNILVLGNIVFIKKEMDNVSCAPKYVKAAIGGYIFSGDVFTYEEIMAMYPDAKPCSSFFNIESVWRSEVVADTLKKG